MQYLAGWRMHLARRMLRESNVGVAELAARVAYESEAAFSRAFRRAVGVPPARWRDAGGWGDFLARLISLATAGPQSTWA